MIKSQKEWDLKWDKIFNHYQQDLRHAFYVRALKNKNENRLLEIGAGSFRDMAAMNRWGISCLGMDFSSKSVQLARKRFPDISDKILQVNAFDLPFGNKEFDLTYHNGIWVLFSDDDIIKLAKEQARITKHRMIVTVHNAHNTLFKQYFEKMSETDPLYNIRFFHLEEITFLMKKVCSKINVIPVGKGKKLGEDRLINAGLGNPSILRSYLKRTKHKFLTTSERLLCIGEISSI